MTLGKGLESLIPPHQSTPHQGDDNQGSDVSDDLSFPERPFSPTVDERASPGTDLFKIEKKDEAPPITTARKEAVFQVEVDKIRPNPHQPRRNFDEASLGELANSIREFGIIQPLVVLKIEKETERGWAVEYELVAGERRLMAAKMAGLATVPALIRQVPVEHEKLELAVTENIQRSDLNPIEFARAIARLQDEFKLTQREIAVRLGKSREVIANSVRLLSLPSEIQEAVSSGRINESQARLLLSVDDVAQRNKLFQETLTNNLTVREVSLKARQLKGETVKDARGDAPPQVGGSKTNPELLAIREQLEELLGAPVELKSEGEGGKLTINFYSKEELEGILAKFRDRQTS